jgi:hypothetical protein
MTTRQQQIITFSVLVLKFAFVEVYSYQGLEFSRKDKGWK